MAVKVKRCTCKNDFQDKEYGDGMRVCNTTFKSTSEVRCTVCGALHRDIEDKKK